MTSDKDAAANVPWRLSGGRLNERPSALRRCPRTGAPSSLRSSATRTRKLSENMAMTPAVDPGKTYVDLIKGH